MNNASAHLTNWVSVASITLLLTACGGGGGSSSGTGTLNLGITDAAIDNAESVVVEFTGVELQPAGGNRIVHDFPTARQIDLRALTGGTTELLLDGVVVPAGRMSWLRLKVNAERDVTDSYIMIDGSMHPLWIPSGETTGLKLNRGFDVPEGGVASFTIDFDLRRSVHKPNGLDPNHILRPTLRLVDGNTDGALTGTISETIIMADADCAGDPGDPVGAVYVFDIADAVDDLDGTGDPITSALVPNDGVYAYTVAFLPEGEYKVAFTCDADIDEPDKDADTDPTDGPVDFVDEYSVTIVAGKTTAQNF